MRLVPFIVIGCLLVLGLGLVVSPASADEPGNVTVYSTDGNESSAAVVSAIQDGDLAPARTVIANETQIIEIESADLAEAVRAGDGRETTNFLDAIDSEFSVAITDRAGDGNSPAYEDELAPVNTHVLTSGSSTYVFLSIDDLPHDDRLRGGMTFEVAYSDQSGAADAPADRVTITQFELLPGGDRAVSTYATAATNVEPSAAATAIQDGWLDPVNSVTLGESLLVEIESPRLGDEMTAANGTDTERFFAVVGDEFEFEFRGPLVDDGPTNVVSLGPENTAVRWENQRVYAVIDTGALAVRADGGQDTQALEAVVGDRPSPWYLVAGYDQPNVPMDAVEPPHNRLVKFRVPASLPAVDETTGDGPEVVADEWNQVTVVQNEIPSDELKLRVTFEDGETVSDAIPSGVHRDFLLNLSGIAGKTPYELELLHDGLVIESADGTVAPRGLLEQPNATIDDGTFTVTTTVQLRDGGTIVLSGANGTELAKTPVNTTDRTAIEVTTPAAALIGDEVRVTAQRPDGRPYESPQANATIDVSEVQTEAIELPETLVAGASVELPHVPDVGLDGETTLEVTIDGDETIASDRVENGTQPFELDLQGVDPGTPYEITLRNEGEPIQRSAGTIESHGISEDVTATIDDEHIVFEVEAATDERRDFTLTTDEGAVLNETTVAGGEDTTITFRVDIDDVTRSLTLTAAWDAGSQNITVTTPVESHIDALFKAAATAASDDVDEERELPTADVIEPDNDADDDGVGFTAMAAILALALCVGLTRYRSRWQSVKR